MKALVTFRLGKLTTSYAHRIYEPLQQYQWQVREPLCHGRPVLPAPETPASAPISQAIHFCLNFSPTAIKPGAYIHYKNEIWARETIDSYSLT